MTVSATSTPIIIAKEKVVEDSENSRSNLAWVPCIRYPINFGKKSILALFDSGSEVNTVYLTFAKELGLPIRPIDVGAQKIDGTTLDTYRMVVTAFSVIDKANWIRFFEETFLVANVCLEVVLGILFLTLSGANVDFLRRELWWRTYTTKEALLTIWHIELISKKEFAVTMLNLEHETYIVHVAFLSTVSLSSTPLNTVHSFCRLQIVGLIAKEALTKVFNQYVNFADVFFLDLASKLSE